MCVTYPKVLAAPIGEGAPPIHEIDENADGGTDEPSPDPCLAAAGPPAVEPDSGPHKHGAAGAMPGNSPPRGVRRRGTRRGGGSAGRDGGGGGRADVQVGAVVCFVVGFVVRVVRPQGASCLWWRGGYEAAGHNLQPEKCGDFARAAIVFSTCC